MSRNSWAPSANSGTDIGPRSAFSASQATYDPHRQSGPTIGHPRNDSCHRVLATSTRARRLQDSIDPEEMARCLCAWNWFIA